MKKAATTIKELPDGCWEMIFNHLDHISDMESVSLVCKRFLSITDFLRVSLTVFTIPIQVLPRLFQRFARLKKIKLKGFQRDLNEVVLAISQSGLDLEELDISFNGSLGKVCFEKLGLKMENLKVLNCVGCNLTDDELIRIANSFPQLEELLTRESDGDNVIRAGTDEGICYLSSKLKRLRKICLSNNKSISDKSLISLSSNCVFLECIIVDSCSSVTEDGISFLINNSHHLNSLVVCGEFKIGSFGVRGATNFPKLQSLSFMNVEISDEFLHSIAEAQIPLTELSLSFCKGYTFTRFSRLLHSHSSLKSLELRGAEFLTNEHVENLSAFLHNLTSIRLNNCSKLSDSAFIVLTQRCPSLCHLGMSGTSLGTEEYNDDSLKKNYTVKSLELSFNSGLTTSGFKRILNLVPTIEKLMLQFCFKYNDQLDVADVLACNRGLVILDLNWCSHLKVFRECRETSMLETLKAQYSVINDEKLAMLGRICPRLVHLDLGHCRNLTKKGVMEVVKSCKRLRYLNLSACTNVNTDVIPWIVTNSPSLRRLISPSCSSIDVDDRTHFWLQSCLVSKNTS